MKHSLNHNKFLSEDERLRLLSILSSDLSPAATLILLSLETGARASELLNISPQDLDASKKRLFIRGLKGSRDRYIPLSPSTFTRLHQIIIANPSTKPFPFTYSYFQKLWYFYRPVKKKLHALRHTFAMELYSRTLDLFLVQKALGHSSISSTMIYLEFASSEKEHLILKGRKGPKASKVCQSLSR